VNSWGEALAGRDFARVPLTKADAAKARELLWQHHLALVGKEREPEVATVSSSSKARDAFSLKTFGMSEAGHSLWISLHGGGGAPKQVNDSHGRIRSGSTSSTKGLRLPRARPTIGISARAAHRSALRIA